MSYLSQCGRISLPTPPFHWSPYPSQVHEDRNSAMEKVRKTLTTTQGKEGKKQPSSEKGNHRSLPIEILQEGVLLFDEVDCHDDKSKKKRKKEQEKKKKITWKF